MKETTSYVRQSTVVLDDARERCESAVRLFALSVPDSGLTNGEVASAW